jgi:uncharacterized protein YfaA (DUF2138 family)
MNCSDIRRKLRRAVVIIGLSLSERYVYPIPTVTGVRYHLGMGIPKDTPTRVGWASGILVSALTVYWWFDSLDGSVFESMPIKILSALITCAIGGYLMLINYD